MTTGSTNGDHLLTAPSTARSSLGSLDGPLRSDMAGLVIGLPDLGQRMAQSVPSTLYQRLRRPAPAWGASTAHSNLTWRDLLSACPICVNAGLPSCAVSQSFAVFNETQRDQWQKLSERNAGRRVQSQGLRVSLGLRGWKKCPVPSLGLRGWGLHVPLGFAYPLSDWFYIDFLRFEVHFRCAVLGF